MGYEKIGPYWFCDDFERFWTYVGKGRKVVYTSNKSRGKMEIASRNCLGGDKFQAKMLFRKGKYRFLDPESVFNPEQKHVVDSMPPKLRWNGGVFVLRMMGYTFREMERRHRYREGKMTWILHDWDAREFIS